LGARTAPSKAADAKTRKNNKQTKQPLKRQRSERSGRAVSPIDRVCGCPPSAAAMLTADMAAAAGDEERDRDSSSRRRSSMRSSMRSREDGHREDERWLTMTVTDSLSCGRRDALRLAGALSLVAGCVCTMSAAFARCLLHPCCALAACSQSVTWWIFSVPTVSAPEAHGGCCAPRGVVAHAARASLSAQRVSTPHGNPAWHGIPRGTVSRAARYFRVARYPARCRY
jgi:hypothetical protein